MKVFLAFTGILCCLQVFAQEQGDRDSAIYYISKGQYARALPFSKRNFETLTKISNNDTARISAAERLGAIYYEQGKDDSTLVYYMKACEGIKKQYGDTSVQYGSALVNIAKTYTRLARYQEAEESYQNAIAILERKDNPYYSKAYTWYLIEYADFSITTGNFNKAEELSLIACEMALREPVDMDAYILAQERLSRFFRKMGFSAQRKAVAIRIFEAAKERYGEEHPKYAMAIGNLGDIYQREKKMEQADSLYRKTLEIKQRTLGNNVPANIHLLTRIGIVNMEMRKYRIAESYLEEVMKIINENGGEKFPLYAYAAKNLAKLYALTGRKELAEPLYQKCLAIYSRNGLVLNSDCLNLLHSMAELFYADDPAKAARYLQEVMVAENKLLLEKLDFLSETELLAWLRANKDIADSPYGFLLHHKSPKIAGAAYNRRLLTGGISLQNIRGLYQSMTQSKDGELTLLWENYQQQKSYYTNLLLTPAAKRNVNTDSVADVLNRQEKDILRSGVQEYEGETVYYMAGSAKTFATR